MAVLPPPPGRKAIGLKLTSSVAIVALTAAPGQICLPVCLDKGGPTLVSNSEPWSGVFYTQKRTKQLLPHVVIQVSAVYLVHTTAARCRIRCVESLPADSRLVLRVWSYLTRSLGTPSHSRARQQSLISAPAAAKPLPPHTSRQFLSLRRHGAQRQMGIHHVERSRPRP